MRRQASAISFALLTALAVLRPAPARADVIRLEILSREPANNGQVVGSVGPFEIIRGRIHGEVDPNDPHNRIIQDLTLAPRNARGLVEYVATFALAKPLDMTKAARVLLYQVVNRGNGQVTIGADGYISLISGWQGDVASTPANQTIVVPVAKGKNGAPLTGPMIARFIDVPAGTLTMPIRLSSMGNTPEQYPPVDLNERGAALTMHASETPRGISGVVTTVPRAAWAFADCAATPFPGTPDPTKICVRDGFRADRIYELTYTAKDPLVLGLGLAATRDIVSFFRYAQRDRSGTPNPVAGAIDKAVSIGDSQSGNFIRSFVHLGFNQDEANRIVWDGVFPRIAARQTPLNHRFALPGGAASLYEVGSDGVVWWGAYADRVRGLPRASLLDRCTATKTCPKVIEAFGSSEFWGLRMSPDLIGTDAKADIPLPENVRRYYYPGTTHGGGRGGFRIEAAPNPAARCSLADNPNPEADTTRALTRALVEWVTSGTPPPASRYPTLANGDLVPATRAAMGLPAIPGLSFNENILNPVLRYDFGSSFHRPDLSGVITRMPPRVVGVLPTYVPRVNADGNETVGVASVLYQAPLGTYLGWNAIRAGVLAGQGCGYTGGYVPFAKTRADREATKDPRPSVEERYGTQDGYVCTVRKAVDVAVRERFLLADDARRLLTEVSASSVLPGNAASSPANVAIARQRCGS
ncbi:MAG: alpha/beta hydrolase domain-containing protein [Acidobacteriota bacterium]